MTRQGAARPVVALRLAVLLAVCAVLGCDATARHKVLTIFFDGVPDPKEAAEVAGAETAAERPLRSGVGHSQDHGPYAARLCTACHVPGTSNGLLASKGSLCLQCHDLKPERKFVHGPVAVGECRACHDPHSSAYRPLLVAAADTLCLSCHDGASLATHAAGDRACAKCHDAHMSDRRFLLR